MHVLATQLATLEEADVAVDLGQSPADVVVLSFSDTDLSALAAAWQQEAELLPTLRLASLKQLRHPMSVDLYLERVVAKAKAVIVRCLGGLDYWRYGLERIADLARDNGILFAALPGDDRADSRLASMSTVGGRRARYARPLLPRRWTGQLEPGPPLRRHVAGSRPCVASADGRRPDHCTGRGKRASDRSHWWSSTVPISWRLTSSRSPP